MFIEYQLRLHSVIKCVKDRLVRYVLLNGRRYFQLKPAGHDVDG